MSLRSCQVRSDHGQVRSCQVRASQDWSSQIRSVQVMSGQANVTSGRVRLGQAMSRNDKARSGLVRFCLVMTSLGQVWSCQRRDRSRSAKDR